MSERTRSVASTATYDPIVPAAVFALTAIAFAAVRWDVATGAALGAIAGYSLSGSV